jgi:hypothetical protein
MAATRAAIRASEKEEGCLALKLMAPENPLLLALRGNAALISLRLLPSS